MKTLAQKIRHSALVMCFALIAALAMESTLEAQKRSGHRSGNRGGSSMRSGGNHRGGNMNRGRTNHNRGSMNHRGNTRRSGNHGQHSASRGSSNRGNTRQASNQRDRNQQRFNRGHGQNASQGQQAGHKQRRHQHTGGKTQNGHRHGHGQRTHNGHRNRGHNNGHAHNNGNRHRQNSHGHNHWKHRHNQFHRHVHWHNHNWRHNHCRQVRANRSLCWNYTKWCGYYPTRCHWWYNYCGSQYYFDPTFSSVCEWTYYPVYVQGVAVTQYRWHLGLDCVYIPGLGYGVQEVESGSPAELAGLAQGMIIVGANGLKLETESAMTDLLNRSNGQLALDVVTDENGQQQVFDVSMVQVPVSN